nr:HDOD domain-containing protein [candidate division Zixibacteria bacterium]
MDSPGPGEIISGISEIGSLPQTLAAVLEIINNPAAGADQIADVISKDVSLTARVLKMVNSAQYSRRRKVSRVTEAVVVMGLNSIKMLTLSSSVFSMMPDNEFSGRCDIKRIWRHLIEVAAGARSIAREINYPEPEEAFVAGILHDMGIIIMLLYFRDRYLDLIDRAAAEKTPLWKIEQQTLGFTHGDLGAEMIDTWKLPVRLSHAARGHHQVDESGLEPEATRLNNMVALADRLTLGPFNDYYPDVEENIRLISEYQKHLGLESETVNRIRKESLQQSITLAEYLDLDVGDVIDIITAANKQLAEIYFSLEQLYIREYEARRLNVEIAAEIS